MLRTLQRFALEIERSRKRYMLMGAGKATIADPRIRAIHGGRTKNATMTTFLTELEGICTTFGARDKVRCRNEMSR
jgi:hypothetical protein